MLFFFCDGCLESDFCIFLFVCLLLFRIDLIIFWQLIFGIYLITFLYDCLESTFVLFVVAVWNYVVLFCYGLSESNLYLFFFRLFRFDFFFCFSYYNPNLLFCDDFSYWHWLNKNLIIFYFTWCKFTFYFAVIRFIVKMCALGWNISRESWTSHASGNYLLLLNVIKVLSYTYLFLNWS